jgi:hypothetical protein
MGDLFAELYAGVSPEGTAPGNTAEFETGDSTNPSRVGQTCWTAEAIQEQVLLCASVGDGVKMRRQEGVKKLPRGIKASTVRIVL